MILKTYPAFLALLIIGCTSKSPETKSVDSSDDPITRVQALEQASIEKSYDSFGEVTSVIEFQVWTDDIEIFEDTIIPWASLEKPELDLPHLFGKDEIVIESSKIQVVIDYPLTNQYEFSLSSEKGFTRGDLLTEISKHYYQMYEEEEATATVKTIPIEERTVMYNRNETDGKYGIWGHDIGDLVLSSIYVHKADNGETILTLNIQS